MSQKQNIKARLHKILTSVHNLKKDMNELYLLHKQFRFSKLLEVLPQKKIVFQNQDCDKQNQLRNANINETARKKLNFDGKNLHKDNNSKNKRQTILREKNLDRNESDKELKNIKAKLIQQMTQIKKMEKQEQHLRRVNQKLKAQSSLQKRSYQESISKQKSSNMSISKASQKTSLTNKTENTLINSDIEIRLPVSLEHNSKVLKCPKGHEYYEGNLSHKNEPDGNGRLEICCSENFFAKSTNKNLKDAEFYQGRFKDGKFHGFGTLSYRGGVKYVGQFFEGRRQGKGSLYFNGKVETAKWENDIFISIM